jgi:tRNA uridine 5-carboxymethylaminomethyl modification enzyme
MTALDAARQMARTVSVTPNGAARHGIELNRDGQRRTAFELLAHPIIGLQEIARIWPQFAALDPKIGEQLEIDAKYAVYLDRQAADVAAYRRDESLALQDGLDYASINGLSMEVRQKLDSIRPRTIGQASRIDGITPAALTLLAAHIRRRRKSASPTAGVVSTEADHSARHRESGDPGLHDELDARLRGHERKMLVRPSGNRSSP